MLLGAAVLIALCVFFMSIGNIVGANIIDLTLILPICSAVSDGHLTIGP